MTALSEALTLLWNDTDITRDFYNTLRTRLEADAQALADVRTLDAFNPNWRMALGPGNSHYCLPRGDALAFKAPTLEGARANAAEWVRKL